MSDAATSKAIGKRYDFVLLFDVQDGNPNGDPDAGNLPRTDPETGHGLVTDVCLKRKIRNYVLIEKREEAPFGIFVKERSVLNRTMQAAFDDEKIDLDAEKDTQGRKRKTKGQAQGDEIDKGQAAMCRRFYDIRTFGAVLSTGPNAGQVRGPVQLTFGRSVDPIVTLEHAVTRMAVTDEADELKERTMGRKATVPYGLYRAHGFVSPAFAAKTGFDPADLDLLWNAFERMFEHDRSAARGLMSTRALIVFEHASPLGSRPAHALFDRVTAKKKNENAPARSFADYEVKLDGKALDAVRVVVPVGNGAEATASAS